MSVPGLAADPRETVVDTAALDDALERVALRVGRLSDEKLRALRRRRGTAVAVSVSAAVVALLTVGVGQFATMPTAQAPRAQTFATLAGQRGMVTLADGSTVALDGATRLEVAYAQGRRTARLLAGQAFFDVRHDPARPFVVQVGQGEVRVLGTAFDLDLTRQQVALAVYRGAVGFDGPGTPRGMVVRAGYRTTLRGRALAVPVRFDPALQDWRNGWIDAAGMRLDDLVEMLGRRTRIAIAPPTGALAELRITGRFRTDRPRELLEAIGEGLGFDVSEGRTGLVLTPRRTARTL